MTVNQKTKRGFTVRARQRANHDEFTHVKTAKIEATQSGLRVTADIGREKGYTVSVNISLDEILAWLPEVTGHRIFEAIELTEKRMREEAL